MVQPNSSTSVDFHHNKNPSFTEGDVRQFTCHVDGSYPKPDVQVFVGSKDITDQFNSTTVLVKGDGPKGLQPLYYKVDMTNTALNIDYEFHDQPLRCVAKMPKTNSNMKADVNIALLRKLHCRHLCKYLMI